MSLFAAIDGYLFQGMSGRAFATFRQLELGWQDTLLPTIYLSSRDMISDLWVFVNRQACRA